MDTNPPASSPAHRSWTTPFVVGGAILLGLLVVGALWVVTGIETTVTVEDKRALVTAGKLGERLGNTVVAAEREVYSKSQLRDLICELKYSYDDTAGSGLLVDHLITRELDENEAESTYFWLEQGLAVMGEGFSEEVLETDLRWGDVGKVTVVRRDGVSVAWRFLGRKGAWVHQIVIGGTTLTSEDFVGIVDEGLTRFERGRPCGG